MILIKNEGVRARAAGIQPEMVLAVMVAHTVFEYYETDLVLTSIAEIAPGRRKGSRHLSGFAVDVRTRDIARKDDTGAIVQEIKHALGPDYDVVLEPDHLHIEFDPDPSQI